MAQKVKDLALLLLWHRLDSWYGNCHMPPDGPKKKKKKVMFKEIKELGNYHVWMC